jgi:GTPase SAR1 family protein
MEPASIFKHLNESSFGKFRKSMLDLGDEVDLASFKLPKVIVIGNESTGKSSLLEKITKFEVFPRDAGICTKMPIRFEMINATDGTHSITVTHGTFRASNVAPESILPDLTRYMAGMTKIVEDEMVIEIKSPHVMTFTVVDLPGIRAFPADMARATKEIAHRYLSDPDALVLCVVPATDTRLTSSSAIGMVMEHGRQNHTILALTMPDRVQDDNFEALVLNRITGRSDELRDCSFAGCVTIKNRESTAAGDIIDLQQSDMEEYEFFDRAFERWSKHPEVHERAVNNSGIGSLLLKMDRMYHEFITTNWKPRALEQLRDVERVINAELAELGDEIVSLNDIVAEIKKNITDVTLAFQTLTFDSYFSDAITQMARDDGIVNSHSHKWASHHWAIESRKMLDTATMWIDMMKEDKLQLKGKLTELIKSAFNTKTSMKSTRFRTVRDTMVSTMLKTYDDLMSAVFDVRVSEFYRKYSIDVYNNTGDMYLFKKTVYGFILVEIMFPALESIYAIPKNTSTVERESYATKRAGLIKKLDSLYRARETISNIETMLE